MHNLHLLSKDIPIEMLEAAWALNRYDGYTQFRVNQDGKSLDFLLIGDQWQTKTPQQIFDWQYEFNYNLRNKTEEERINTKEAVRAMFQ